MGAITKTEVRQAMKNVYERLANKDFIDKKLELSAELIKETGELKYYFLTHSEKMVELHCVRNGFLNRSEFENTSLAYFRVDRVPKESVVMAVYQIINATEA